MMDKLSQLAPILRVPVSTLIERARREHGYILQVVYSWRSVKDQMDLYKQGRRFDAASKSWIVADKTAVVTQALPGRSAHNVITLAGQPGALAVDLCPWKPDQSGLWWEAPDAVWTTLYDIAADCGLDPLGDRWGEYLDYDKAHFQEPGWKLKLSALDLTLPDAVVLMQEA